MEFRDFLAAKLGTRRWVVAPRLTDRLKAKGYDRAITQKRFNALDAEHRMMEDMRIRPSATA